MFSLDKGVSFGSLTPGRRAVWTLGCLGRVVPRALGAFPLLESVFMTHEQCVPLMFVLKVAVLHLFMHF